MDSIYTFSALQPIWPELFMAFMVLGLLLIGVFKGHQSTRLLTFLAIGGLLFVAFLLLQTPTSKEPLLHGKIVIDLFAVNMKLIFITALIASYLLSIKYLYDTGFVKFEYPVLIMMAGIGMFFMVSSHHMLATYMALELQAFSLYILAAFNRDSLKSAEAGIKYFILGAVSSGFILFGVSLLYGFTGHLNYSEMADVVSGLTGPERTGAVFGMMFVLSGVAFKIAAVPFHMWIPDVYEGAPIPVTAFFALVSKLAAIALLFRLLLGPFETLVADWQIAIAFLSVMSMTWAAFAGLVQNNLKRLMAYSSIGNIGYALLGIVTLTSQGFSATLFYLILYMVMTAGVFGVLLCMQRDGVVLRHLEDLAGMSKNHPVLAYAMAILMFSMSALPPFSGFFGKLVIFQEVIAQELYMLAVIGVVSSVIATYYYLRVVKVMFFDEPDMPYTGGFGPFRSFVITASVLFAVFYILFPDSLMPFTQRTVNDLLPHGVEPIELIKSSIEAEQGSLPSFQELMKNAFPVER